MQDFEGMVAEAKTLQGYLDELQEHESDVKSTIYHKLQVEYTARKTVIFKSEEFKTLHTDVEQDLLDMLAKQKDFVETVERLNEELEEITVRHMVGEYSNQVLSEREEAQKAEITQWNEKTEKITQLIARYQESLEAEKALNPLHEEQEEIAEEVEGAKGTEDIEAETLPEEQETEEVAEETLPAEQADEEIEEEPPLTEPDTIVGTEQEPLSTSEELEEEAPGQEEISEEFPEAQQELEDLGEEVDDEGLFDAGIEIDTDFGEEGFEVDDSLGIDEGEDEELSVAYEVEAVGEEEAEQPEEETISCKKCGRQTPASEKFCVHCGGKAR
jgi:chromosome segregation ATPase